MAQQKLTMVLAAETTQFSKKMSDVSKRIKSLNSDVQRFGKSFLSNINLIKAKSASALVAAVSEHQIMTLGLYCPSNSSCEPYIFFAFNIFTILRHYGHIKKILLRS